MRERSSAEIEEIISRKEMGALLDSIFEERNGVLMMDDVNLLGTAAR